MYPVNHNGKTILEADACGIGFLASRKGVADRRLVELALHLATQFDHRGAPGHGAGVQLDIPWPLLIDRFSEHTKLIAQRDVALGMFFLPFDAPLRRRCVEMVEELADLAGSRVLAWADVPMDPGVLDPKSGALRTLPHVRQALFKRPDGMSEDGWFTCRYLLRLALETQLGDAVGDEFAIASLSNRTVVYKGLGELSKIGRLYPDLSDPHTASKFVLFHSRYCTNTTTAWRRAQPFWAIAHNGEIATIAGNVAWMDAIGRDLIRRLIEKHPSLERIAGQVGSIVNPGGSDSANLDDMVIALIAGGMSLPQAILAVLPEASAAMGENARLQRFYQSMSTFLGACDGPAAIVTCDGDHAVAHLDRNGLRPLWIGQTKDYVVAASELTGNLEVGEFEVQRLMGPGETVVVNLNSGDVLLNEEVHLEVARRSVPDPTDRTIQGRRIPGQLPTEGPDLTRMEQAFGMTKEDLDVVLEPLVKTGKAALGSMGDDTSPAAMLDSMPRRLEDYFALRFAQETSPPIDPVRDAWVFDMSVMLGDRGGLWSNADGQIFGYPSRILASGEVDWLNQQDGVYRIALLYPSELGPEGEESALESVIEEACRVVPGQAVIVLSDRFPSASEAPLQPLRVVSRLHHRLVSLGVRHRVGLVADVGVWDIHHAALLVTMGADAVCPWIGCAVAGEAENRYLEGLRAGFLEAMSMMGVTPSSAYCGARLAEAIGLCADFLKDEFPGVPGHLGGIDRGVVAREWRGFYDAAFAAEEADQEPELSDVGEFRHTKNGRRHANNAEIVRALHTASGYAAKIHGTEAGSWEAYLGYAKLVSERDPLTPLDCLQLKKGTPIPLEEVESEEQILWRFMAPGMSEGALSEPAHRSVARGMNTIYRYARLLCHLRGKPLPTGFGPFSNSGEGGFSKERIHNNDRNRSVQYAGGRFTITPMTAACAEEAEVKFAQGAKPGKGGQLPGKKVSERIANQRGCEPGYELVSPPINHNLYSIEDVKLMLESWRHLNPNVNCALKFVATYGVEMVCQGGVNAGANRLHISDGCGGTGAAKRVDQKHAGVPAAAVLPVVQDLLVEADARHLIELSCDGGVQNGEQALKLMLLGADRVGFGTSLLIAIGCSMLRKCHLSGPDPNDPTGKRRLGCTPGVATQDPQFVARFTGSSKHVARMMRFVAREIRLLMAEIGIRRLADVVGRRDFLERKPTLTGKSAQLDLGVMLRAPHRLRNPRAYAEQTARHMPSLRIEEHDAAHRALAGDAVLLEGALTNVDRCVGLGAAGIIARERGDLGLGQLGSLTFLHTGAAGHFYAAYSVDGMSFRLHGLAADSCFTAAYGGKLVIVPDGGRSGLTVVGNTFAYGARGGRAYLAGRGGNRFGICLRKNHEGGGPVIVVEGVEANAFQYMTGGTAVVLGSTGYNLGSGLTGGRVFLLDADARMLNADYVQALAITAAEAAEIRQLVDEHLAETGSKVAAKLLENWDPERFSKVVTRKLPESVEFYGSGVSVEAVRV